MSNLEEIHIKMTKKKTEMESNTEDNYINCDKEVITHEIS